MSEKIFANGLSFKRPNEKAPEFVKGNLSIKTDDFITFLKANTVNGWVNLDLKESQGGKLYFELNTWKPQDKFVKKDGKIAVEELPTIEQEYPTNIDEQPETLNGYPKNEEKEEIKVENIPF